jgi:hypothetical protein
MTTLYYAPLPRGAFLWAGKAPVYGTGASHVLLGPQGS